MEDNFRNTLIIISAIVIAAIFIHGYWTIRKQKNPYKLKTKVEPVAPQSRGFDGSGFDQDGVSKPKVVGANAQREGVSVKSHLVEGGADFHSDEPMPSDIPLGAFEEKAQEQRDNFGALLNDTEAVPEHLKLQALSDAPDYEGDFFPESDDNVSDADEDIIAKPVYSEPVYQQPVTHAKPEILTSRPVAHKKNVRKPKVKRNQMEINFGDESAKDMPSMSATQVDKKPAAVEIEPQVIVLSVVMPQGQAMSGAALLPTLLTLGMKYGEMNIFHRHQDNAGNGKVTFSLANMMNPGTFNLDDIENFSTQGITLFMTLPNPGDAFEVFEQMLNAAKQLAVEFRGQLLDHKRSVMTKQTEQHYIGLIREFERKSRIGSL
ncbi:cell division protein ZipA [Colwellia sp. BRX10-3]|uniref:cell division protein ZipA n=1 Tax=Colwellia sp. BRX10-3 TaxID=2759844 RepID=UPI0015F40B73|nr:cell division protein ZipA [Colwellia sp. BRX10-3]MBA6391826.1 cell division protein ZipA [Colwellia sp. BRX10-3]